MAALPNEVGSAVLATAEMVLLLDDELSQFMVKYDVSHLANTYDAIDGHDLRVGFIAAGAFQLYDERV